MDVCPGKNAGKLWKREVKEHRYKRPEELKKVSRSFLSLIQTLYLQISNSYSTIL